MRCALVSEAVEGEAPRPSIARWPLASAAETDLSEDYFMRDRGLWFLDEFVERFGEAPRFLVYRHPTGLSLAGDFEALAAALELAIMLRRRVILPTTMNCRNCPAYEPYGLSAWPRRGDGSEMGCTFDYFSRAGLMTGEWLRFAAESSVALAAEFRRLRPRRRIATEEQWRPFLRACVRTCARD